MSRLSDLVRQVAKSDPQLAKDLQAEVKALEQRRAFGLNFERHTPESVELYGRPVRRRDKVRILPKRGEPASGVDRRIWEVRRVSNGVANLVHGDGATEHDVADLVVMAEFRDRIYPGMVSTGKVEHGGDKPFHTVINAENFHALEALAYTHEGRVDAIYIDPPYNTGARDWKYNNDYVDGEDIYRHSKWLAFMERRLKIAKRLLNPENSVLIVTIDEKEYLRLGQLLEQTFSEARIQMVSIVTNHRGVARAAEFSRVNEYAFFVNFGVSGPDLVPDDLLSESATESNGGATVRWERLIKGSNNARRVDRPRLFYPVFVDPERKAIAGVGDPISLKTDRRTVDAPADTVAVWPLAMDGTEKRWQLSAETLRSLVAAGRAKAGAYDAKNDRWSILYLNKGQLERISRGEIRVLGRDLAGVLELETVSAPAKAGMTVWNRSSHNAGYYGAGVVRALLGGRRFPFPKSLYAVEDTLRFYIADKPDAVVLDFFAGSGTTAHAVMRLNKQDGGHRQCISVTNNEVSAEEQRALREQGLRPGDAEWEKHGICDYITKPRIEAAITGSTPDGQPIKGDYKFTDEFPMSDGFEENAEFFTLTYEDRLEIAHRRGFRRIAPLLWLKAGARGRRIDEPAVDFAVADTYAILFDLDSSHEFLEAVAKADGLNMVYVLTDDERAYQDIVAEVPSHLATERLYSGYLTAMDRGPQVD